MLKWFATPFPLDHILSDLSIITCLSWVALLSMAHSQLTELDKTVIHVINLISFLWLWFSFCLDEDKRLVKLPKLPNGRDWLWVKLGLALMGKAMLNGSGPKSGSVSFGVPAPFSWALVHTRFCLCPLRVCFPGGLLIPFAGSLGWEICCGPSKFCYSARTYLV